MEEEPAPFIESFFYGLSIMDVIYYETKSKMVKLRF